MKKLIFIIILTTVFFAYGQTDEKEAIEQTNRQVIALYKSGKFDDALKLALQVVEGSIKVYGGDSRDTAAAYLNLGLIYREKKKFKESAENLQKSAEIYEKLPAFEAKELVSIYERLAQVHSLDKKTQEAESKQLRAVEVIENKFGKESKESYLAILSLANFYSRNGNTEKANETYLKSYALAVKYFGKDGQEVEQIGKIRLCSSLSSSNPANAGDYSEELYKKFVTARNALLGYEPELDIINKKAASMPFPPYPAEAKRQRIGGKTAVQVKVDENGNVFEAKLVCGNPLFEKVVEEAAKKSKFHPFLKDGKPSKSTGILIFIFVAT